MRVLVLVLGFLGLLSVSVGQIEQNGQCDPNIPLVTNFDIERFLGIWYEHRRGANPVQGGDCSNIEFSVEDNGYTFYNRALNKNFVEELRGTVTNNGPTLTLNLNNAGVPTTLEVSILAIDNQYNLFALAYRCENIDASRRRIFLWQLGRAAGPPTSTIDALVTTTLNNLFGITTNDLVTVDNSEIACYELPIIAPNQPVILPGQCDANLRGVPEFNVPAFIGTWHEIESYYSSSAEGSCPRARYTLDGSTVGVENSEVINQELRTIFGTATVISDDGSARLRVTLEVQPGVFSDQELFILATDYENYAISYTCVNDGDSNKRVFSWILGKSRQLSSTTQADVDRVIDQYLDLNKAYYQEAARSDADCFYYPQPEAGRVVTFRGTCDLNIPVVNNFNVARYLGTWYDLESYPSVFQGGDCNTANYALRPNTDPAIVDVHNTMVIGETLDIMNGEARLATTDGSGKLLVTFPIAGTDQTVETSYWVLDTDYDNYALVYTCQQVDEDTRNVWAWKLSRTKELTNTATENINSIIESIDVLQQRYFDPKDHSVEGCFYIPQPTGNPVIFPGQCDLDIPVVNGFNFDSFEGTWHEIEAYPKDDQSSTQCITHQWTLNTGNTFSLSSSAVIDQFLRVTTSTVSTSDNSARLTIRLNDQDVEIPFWIIATDYDNYALAYSCVNRNLYTKAVYSWKLSRSRSLTQTDITAIDDAMTNIDVLDNRYFEKIGQTDEDCFYLPELAPGQPIILPGQCDPNIQVVTQFRVAEYLKRWHMIETYPSAFQDGDCNDATYALNDDDSINVLNTQVVNQRLDTITGRATVIPSDDDSAKLLVTFPDAPEPIEYWVLATDYTSYSLVYSCRNINTEQRQVWSWKLSQSKSLTPEATTAINYVISQVNVLHNQYYQRIDNSDNACFYYPEPNGLPVVFRGQCDESIAVVQPFDAERYMGPWYDIESYPSVFQGGSCNSAYYTLNTVPSVFVDVYNTQVVDQTLDVIEGVAVPAFDDGSAKLIVSFPIAGTDQTTSTNYWVLDTDYDSYALVYTCANLDDESRQVYSWKLSRNRELTPTAQSNINNAISSIPVLDEKYFGAKDHSPAGCFYYPEDHPDRPVVFPGTCDANVPVKQEFDLGQFIGTWYEVETYPKEFAPGRCISHQYSPGGLNTLTLQTSAVDNQALVVSQSTVTSPGAGNPRLTLTMDNGVTIPFWIIETDYTDYALAYSCVDNIQAGNRGVYSWKLSRSKSLSNTAITNINNAMQPIDVIDQRYFVSVDQSDEGCFYFPQLAPDEPVVFPGQCDAGIAPMQGFDAQRFSGRWFDIESYYDDDYQGQCVDSRFTLAGNSYNIVFSQVVNENLISTTSTATIAADQTGRLTVSSPSGTVEFLVLATDYDNYALIYSCNNQETNSRRVRSWKMSKTRELSAESQSQIATVIANIDVLDERYYNRRDHSQTACFYYPTYVPGQVVRFRGQCDANIAVVQEFDLEKYLGTWYDIESYPNAFQDGTCATAQYTLSETQADVVNVYNTQVVNQLLDTIEGTAEVASNDGSAKLSVTFPIAGTDQFISTPYWVLSTDYDNYALVYSCNQFDDEYYTVNSWKLSRTRQLTPDSQSNINDAISSIPVLNEIYFEDQDHSAAGCFYFPEDHPERPVVFPGTCDANVPVKQDFDLGQFIGTWYEVETYPKEFAPGRCISHQYSPGGLNTLNLQTSAVNNQALVVSQSTVTSPGAGNPRLTLTMDNGVTIPFWIIETDYTDYALAYSCVDNTQAGNRGVYSWKLSRSKSLSNTAITNINNAMQPIDVIDQRYFVSVDQSDEGCFYFPQLAPDEPVVFPGQCDAGIAPMQGFDAQRFSGRWFDIESYYDDDYQGQCVDSRFTLAGNSYNIVFSQVVNENLISTTSTATIAADQTGRLTVTSPSGTVEFLVLATDYDNYALIYSCNNEETNSRRVRSWKMSKTRELSVDSQTQIGTVIANIDVLDERYYNGRDHSQTACFYYPTPVPGQVVRFRGQCDANIAVVQEFDLEEYLGTWYDIESYPNAFQDGTCATALYSLSETQADVVDVHNTQVVNQLLDTIDGTAEVASTDGSAKLSVTFPIAGTDQFISTPYWVLSTDYDNYALVYSCNQFDDEYYTIGSWKLSRERTLSPESQIAINNKISEVKELRQEYFEETGHTEEDCFFYRDLNGGSVILPGTCPLPEEINVLTGFEHARFSGTWYEVSRFPSNFREVDCSTTELTVNGDNYDWQQRGVKDQELYASRTEAVGQPGSGIYTVQFGQGAASVQQSFFILDTDYTSFALVYSCLDRDDNQKQIYSYKLSRTTSALSPEANARIDEIVSSTRDLFENYYEETVRNNDACFYYPRFEETPDVITMPGPCPNVNVVQDFDAASYLGTWYEIARFPHVDQPGTCSRAQYSSGEDQVDVRNTDVIDQRLNVQIGSAVVKSTDNSGILEITFDVTRPDGTVVTVVADYYVLATDYTDYAFVYNCRDAAQDGFVNVYSWILSRQKSLSDAATTVIKSKIEEVRGLLEEYYVETSQSDEDCFYIPERVDNQAPLFRGTCKDLTLDDNRGEFDAAAFLGWWHETESYPIDDEPSECISSRYQQSGTSIQVVDTRVNGLESSVNSVTVEIGQDWTIIRRAADGTETRQHILTTDYNTYALVYSCEDVPRTDELDDDYQRIWSAKLSNTTALSEAANAAMEPIILNNVELQSHLYRPVLQTEEACFHYPDPALVRDRVILRGQCSESTPVQADFALESFTGSWYQIERYPYPEVSSDSTCIGTRYTIANETTRELRVLNWEVVNGDLRTIEGTAVQAEDGSARFSVTLPSLEEDGESSTRTLHILETNYVSYAVVMTCENLNEYERVVVAFKLGREREFNQTDVTQINTLVSQRQELYGDYFSSITHTDECEEPSSGYFVRSSIGVLLICAVWHLLI